MVTQIFILIFLKHMMIIGITGPIASGKSEVARVLIDKGFIRHSLSDEVREEARKRGMPIERKVLQDIGNEMRKKEGLSYWAKRVVSKITTENNYIVDGIRNPGEIEELQKLGNFILIGVKAPMERRVEWIKERHKDSDPNTIEGITFIDSRDRGKGEEVAGQQVDACYEKIDLEIINDGSLEELRKKIEGIIEEQMQKGIIE